MCGAPRLLLGGPVDSHDEGRCSLFGFLEVDQLFLGHLLDKLDNFLVG